jgi:hypothetical protein
VNASFCAKACGSKSFLGKEDDRLATITFQMAPSANVDLVLLVGLYVVVRGTLTLSAA